MRYIKTSNDLVEFIEAGNDGQILSVRAFQFGELYFQIKNRKVTFYLNDQENPWRNDVWTADIPLQIDEEVYETEEETSAALHSIMNDSFQEQLDQLKEDLAEETTERISGDTYLEGLINAEKERAKTAEDALDNKIDAETARAKTAEDTLDNKIDAETARAKAAEDALDNKLDAEIIRSTAKDAEHDALISGLTNSLNNEISRAISAETEIANDLDQEIADRTNADSALNTKIENEITRSTSKDAEHDEKISGLTDDFNDLSLALNSEIRRAISAETSLRNDLNGEITRANSEETRIEGLIINEVNRSTVKDAEHDEKISKLENDLDDEITRATAAENALDAKIDLEITNRIADVNAEETRATSEEQRIENKLDSEITRSTAKDAEYDGLISGLTNSLNNEISRATSAETTLHNEILAEEARALDAESALASADNAMAQRITALEVGKADKSDVYTKAESDAKYATKEYVSGNTYTKAEIATMMADKADKLNAVSTALYNSQNKTIDFKNIYGNVIASVDARDFIKDGMVNNAEIINNNLVITFNTDAGKEDIVVPLTDIFDPSNYYTKAETDEAISDAIDDIDLSNYYTKTEVDASQLVQDNKINAISANTYTKSEVDASQLVQDNKINAISGDVQTLSGKVDTISGDVITLGGNVQTLSGEVQTISGNAITSGEVESMIDEAVSGKQDTLSAGTNIKISNNVISATDTKYTAGKGIAISTANTISFGLPIWKGVSTSIIEGNELNTASAQFTHAEGYQTKATAQNAHAEGELTNAKGYASHAEGQSTTANGSYSHSQGYGSLANGEASHAGGYSVTTNNRGEFASGKFNISNSDTNDAVNTLFSVGNGENNDAKHNAFEIKKNGDIYISSGGTTSSPMIKLQDHLGGGGGGGVTPTEVQTMIDNSLVGYQEELTAGTGIDITNNVISVTGGSQPVDAYTKAESDAKFATITNFNTHSGNTSIHVTASEKSTWNAKADASSVYNKTEIDNKLSVKPNVWCGNESEWSQISGSTESGTIYLVY